MDDPLHWLAVCAFEGAGLTPEAAAGHVAAWRAVLDAAAAAGFRTPAARDGMARFRRAVASRAAAVQSAHRR